MSEDDPELGARIQAAATTAGESSSDEPDESTRKAIKNDELEQKKARSAGLRADNLEEVLLSQNLNQIEWLRTELDQHKDRILRLEGQLDGHATAQAELAHLKSPRALRNGIVALFGLSAALGGLIMNIYPQGSKFGLLSLTPDATFGCGSALVFLSATCAFFVGQEWAWAFKVFPRRKK